VAGTSVETKDLSALLYDIIDALPNVRAYAFIADNVRVPAAVIGQPTLDFTDQSGGFCRAVWQFPVTVITSRSSERNAQAEMSRLLLDIVTALGAADPAEVLSLEPLTARPLPGVAVNGQELPAYQLDVRIRA